jgi:hypothetical protein
MSQRPIVYTDSISTIITKQQASWDGASTHPVSRTSEDKVLAAWRECHGVDSALVRLDLRARLARVFAARVPADPVSEALLDLTGITHSMSILSSPTEANM